MTEEYWLIYVTVENSSQSLPKCNWEENTIQPTRKLSLHGFLQQKKDKCSSLVYCNFNRIFNFLATVSLSHVNIVQLSFCMAPLLLHSNSAGKRNSLTSCGQARSVAHLLTCCSTGKSRRATGQPVINLLMCRNQLIWFSPNLSQPVLCRARRGESMSFDINQSINQILFV